MHLFENSALQENWSTQMALHDALKFARTTCTWVWPESTANFKLPEGRMWCEHDLPITALEALLHAHGLIRFLVDLFAEGLLVLAAVDVHPRTSCRFYGVVQRTSPFEAEALGDDPGLPSLDLGSTGAVGACAGEEEE